jgi:hypothetical protein
MKPVDLENGRFDDCNHFIEVNDVFDESPADGAGFRKGDIIISVNDTSTCREREDLTRGFRQLIEKQGIDGKVTFGILRDGKDHSLSATLDEWPFQFREESRHEDFDRCTSESSLLGKNLLALDNLTYFQKVRSDLYYKSNLVHNPWLSRKIANPYQLKEFTYMLRHPLRSREAARDITDQILSLSTGSSWDMAALVNYLALLLGADGAPDACSDLTVSSFLKVMEQTHEDVRGILDRLTPEEISLLRETALEPWDDERWNTVLDVSLKLRYPDLIRAFYPLLSCFSSENLSSLKGDLEEKFQETDSPVLYQEEMSFGKVIIGGTASNTYGEDAALVLDIGGDDVYLNNAGGTRSALPVAVLIDWGGDDHYMTRENFSQGAGILGGGVLIDLGGTDAFHALDGSQGTGLFGIGVLFHAGGKSIVNARNVCQGVGQFGIGIFWNRDRESLYQCSLYGQGLGFFGGAGVMIDADGHDYYHLGGLRPDFRDPSHSTISMGQGFGKGMRSAQEFNGISGGVGILVDKGGDDYYTADYFSQGASYFFGVGILNDVSGNDHYIAGRYAQGAGIHSSVGVFIDESGDDFYDASFGVAQGLGHDYGVGFFDDMQGDDRYSGGILSQGSATVGGVGVLVDRGGNDSYSIKSSGQGHAEDEFGIGIMIDLEPYSDSVSSREDVSIVRVGVKKE